MRKKIILCVLLLLMAITLSAIVPANLVLSFDPLEQEVEPNREFVVSLDCLSMNFNIAAFEMLLTFDPDVLEMDYDFYKERLRRLDTDPMLFLPGPMDEMGRSYTLEKPGVLRVICFNVNGFGNNLKVELVPLHMKAKGNSGKTEISVTIESLTDTATRDLLKYTEGPDPAQITISDTACPNKPGDVNGDSEVNIIDALLICNYPYGTWRTNFEICAADVDQNGNINIIDALLIAQYYVGYITEFPKR